MLEQTAHRIQRVIIIFAFLSALAAWAVLPADAKVPVHFDLQGDADDWVRASTAVFFVPAFMLLSAILCHIRLRTNPDHPRSIYAIPSMVIANSVVLVTVQAYVISLALGWIHPSWRLWPLYFGATLMVAGNFMGKVRPGSREGFKSLSWATVNDDVWDQTHRFAGKALVLGGLTTLLLSLADLPVKWQGAAVVVPGLCAVLAIVLKSYLLARPHLRGDPKRRFLRVALKLPFLLLFLYGAINFYDGPYKPCGVDAYCGKGGTLHSEQDAQAYERWLKATMFTFVIAFASAAALREPKK